ncbi:MAG TPA: DUF1612 domain-containing protein [Methylocystis sp.]
MGPHAKQRRGKDEPFYHRRRRELGATEELPPTLAAAVAYEAWRDIEPLEHQNWLGTLLVADLLRQRGKALSHLPCLNVGLRAIPGIVTLAIFTCQAANLPSAGRHKINRLRQGSQSQNGLESGYTRPT